MAPAVTIDTALSIDHLDLLHWRLVWIYDAPRGEGALQWAYCDYPTAAWLIRSGTVELEFSSGEREVYGKGQWVFPCQREGIQSFSADVHILSVRFHAEWPNGAALFDRSRTLCMAADTEPALQLEAASIKLYRFLEERLPEQVLQRRLTDMTIVQYLELQPIFFAWLSAYARVMLACGCEPITFSITHEKARLALGYLQAWPLERPLQMPVLARQTGMSLSQLNKVFVQEMGMTPTAFWTQRRLKVARSELANSTDSIKSIAQGLGFASPEAFARWFRSCCGHSPRDYREIYLRADN